MTDLGAEMVEEVIAIAQPFFVFSDINVIVSHLIQAWATRWNQEEEAGEEVATITITTILYEMPSW